MRRAVLFAGAAAVAAAAALAVSPYFTASQIDEALPSNVAPGPGAGTQAEAGIMERDAREDARLQSTLDGEMDIMEADSRKDAVMQPPAGEFRGAGDGVHFASGSARVLPLEDGSRVLRLEGFEVTNGPDLRVYLASDASAADHIDLGALKASSGNQNYAIPADADLDEHGTVLVWCRAFSTLFGSAQLS